MFTWVYCVFNLIGVIVGNSNRSFAWSRDLGTLLKYLTLWHYKIICYWQVFLSRKKTLYLICIIWFCCYYFLMDSIIVCFYSKINIDKMVKHFIVLDNIDVSYRVFPRVWYLLLRNVLGKVNIVCRRCCISVRNSV